jgi:hypothetical protein
MYKLEDNSINGEKLNEVIFEEELCEWTIIHRESFIDELYHWISEAIRSDRADAQLMKDDQQMLMKKTDEYIFSSNSTNDYVCSDDDRFNEICEDLLKLNGTEVDKYIEVTLKVLIKYSNTKTTAEEVVDNAAVCFYDEKEGYEPESDSAVVVDYLKYSFKDVTKRETKIQK